MPREVAPTAGALYPLDYVPMGIQSRDSHLTSTYFSVMKVFFAEPPPAQAEGGLEQAMATLATYFASQGLTLRRKTTMREIWEETPDLVHFHGLWQPAHAVISGYCQIRGIPYIVSPHGMLEPWAWAHKSYKKRPYFRLVEKRHLNRASALLTTSGQEADNLRPFGLLTNIKTIPLPIPEKRAPDYEQARAELNWDRDTHVLLYLSRVHPKKGLHLLLKALTGLTDEKSQRFQLVVVGDGPAEYMERLRSYAQRHASSLPVINWEGAVWGEQKWRYLQGADLFCLPTYSENFGIVVLEALQVGTPVLTTDKTPWSFIGDWNGGIITEPDVVKIREGLRLWSRNQARYTPRHVLADRTTKEFAVGKLGKEYIRLYEKVAGV